MSAAVKVRKPVLIKAGGSRNRSVHPSPSILNQFWRTARIRRPLPRFLNFAALKLPFGMGKESSFQDWTVGGQRAKRRSACKGGAPRL